MTPRYETSNSSSRGYAHCGIGCSAGMGEGGACVHMVASGGDVDLDTLKVILRDGTSAWPLSVSAWEDCKIVILSMDRNQLNMFVLEYPRDL